MCPVLLFRRVETLLAFVSLAVGHKIRMLNENADPCLTTDSEL